MFTVSSNSRIVRRVFSASAWAMLAWVVVGMISTVPDVDKKLTAIDANPAVHMSVIAFLIIVLLTALSLWASAIWYTALVTRGNRNETTRRLILALLILGNWVAAFFYYFAYVHWRSLPSTVAAK